jgi:hypothetical protein
MTLLWVIFNKAAPVPKYQDTALYMCQLMEAGGLGGRGGGAKKGVSL